MNAATTIITVLAAKMAAERKALIEALQKASAFSSTTAQSHDKLPTVSDSALSPLSKAGVIKTTDDGRWYLDRPRLAEYNAKQTVDTKIALFVLLAVGMLATGLVIFVLSQQ